jgi:hypothetical protein
MKRLALLLALVLSPALARAETVDLGPKGVLSLSLPAGWTMSSKAEEGSGVAITLTPPGDANAAGLLNVTILPTPEPLTKEKVQEQALAISEQFVAASVEKKKELREFHLAAGFGYYCVFTDASRVGLPPKKDDFKVIGVGVVGLRDDVFAAVGMSADDEKGPEFTALVAAVSSLSLSAAK